MYEEFFGLTEKPFSIQPDPSFLYWGRGHRLAYAMLEYGVLNHAGISVISGEVGCGKTTLIHRLLDQLSSTHAVALLSNIQQGRGDLLSWVLMGFGQPFAGRTHVELFSQLQAFFIAEYAKGRRVVLIIDEAQNLSVDQLEELRMLSNINAGKDQLLQLILVGQPQLKDLLNRPDMLQLAQRVGADFHLTPLSREEVDAYVDTRLTIAGAANRIFADGAIDLIAEHSRGVPRVINIICDTALVYAFSAHEKTVSAETIESVIRDKADYGVFGLAADQRTALRSGPQANAPAAPPRIVVSDEGAAARLRREGVPPLRAVAREDQPRMPTPRRRARLADGAPESAAMSIEDAQPVAIQKASVDLFHAEARVADRLAPPEAAPAARTGAEPAVEVRPARAPSLADKRAEPARQVAETPAAATAIGVVIVDGSITPEAAIRAVADVGDLVFVAQSSDQESIEAARRAGVDVVEVADRALTFGRARNAGYRQLKKRRPALNYVQFIDSDVALDPQWLSAAAKFMDRRPEVAAIEGKIRFENEASSVFARMAAIDANGESGETDTVGANLFVRADAFEGAGGFRGDLMVNETRDLCIRLRRRGAHIWRLDADMGIAGARSGGLAAHWESAVRRGFEFAHGAALHGAAPDRLFISERARALVWGALLPAMIVLGAIGGALFAVFLSPLTNPILLAVGALAVGALVYLIKFVVTAAGLGSRPAAWPYAFWSTLGRTPEAAGIFRYFFGGARPRQQKKPA
ncbi:MAG: AAA family ATPase [Parvularculaceae bacterium]